MYRDAVVEGEPQDRREVAEAVEGRSEGEADIMEEMEGELGELGDDSSMGEAAVGQPGSVYEGLKDQRARGEEEQEPEGELEALRRELDRLRQKEVAREEEKEALRLENEALKMEIKGVQAQMQAAKFDNEAKELRRQAQVSARPKGRQHC